MVRAAKACCPQGQDTGLYFQRPLLATEPNLGASLHRPKETPLSGRGRGLAWKQGTAR